MIARFFSQSEIQGLGDQAAKKWALKRRNFYDSKCGGGGFSVQLPSPNLGKAQLKERNFPGSTPKSKSAQQKPRSPEQLLPNSSCIEFIDDELLPFQMGVTWKTNGAGHVPISPEDATAF